jgi:branched-chain amino acid transport system ATP-binding protein
MSQDERASSAATTLDKPPIALALEDITAGYGHATVLRGVSLQVPASSVVAVLGPNGAGKTTLLRVATGTLKPRHGRIVVGGEDVSRRPAHYIAKRGFRLVPEGRGIFPSLSVKENLLLASPKGDEKAAIERAITHLPVLGSRLKRLAASLSGGEQQMLALGQAMAGEPTLLAVDEVSLGLSPVIVDRVYDILRGFVASGIAVILVEQYINRAIDFADSVYLLNRGSVAFHGPASEVEADKLFVQYLGSGQE